MESSHLFIDKRTPAFNSLTTYFSYSKLSFSLWCIKLICKTFLVYPYVDPSFALYLLINCARMSVYSSSKVECLVFKLGINLKDWLECPLENKLIRIMHDKWRGELQEFLEEVFFIGEVSRGCIFRLFCNVSLVSYMLSYLNELLCDFLVINKCI